jgi:hypothetical protein
LNPNRNCCCKFENLNCSGKKWEVYQWNAEILNKTIIHIDRLMKNKNNRYFKEIAITFRAKSS